MIDPRAVIQEGAEIHPTAEVGAYAVVGPNVKVGAGTVIGPHAVIEGWTTIGEDCRIFSHAAVGFPPQDLKYKGERTTLTIGDRTMVREFASVHIGTEGGGGATSVGSDCLLMACSHVAHDCTLGDHVILANAATLAGHVIVHDWVIVGGLTAVHQFARLGEHSMIGGCSAVPMDVPPYVTASGNRAKLYGLNTVGLKRRGFDDDSVKALKRAYRVLFQSEEPMVDLVEQVKQTEEYRHSPEVRKLVEFIEKSERGVTR
ncbi:MAG TPA: acyl-ACP--UDP-N-acetylglucosamine O-acyltransferase [Geobacteraceae bacterium]